MSRCEVSNLGSTSYGGSAGSQDSALVINSQNYNVQMRYNSGSTQDPVLSPAMQNQATVVQNSQPGEQLTVTLHNDNSQPAPTIITPPPGYVPLAEDKAVQSASMGLAGVAPGIPSSQTMTGPLTVEDGPTIRATYGTTNPQDGVIKYVTPASGRRLQKFDTRTSTVIPPEANLPKLAASAEGSDLNQRSLATVETLAESMTVAIPGVGISWDLQDVGRNRIRQLKAVVVGNTDGYAAAAAGVAAAPGAIVYAAKCYQMCVGMGQQTLQTTITPTVQQGE